MKKKKKDSRFGFAICQRFLSRLFSSIYLPAPHKNGITFCVRKQNIFSHGAAAARVPPLGRHCLPWYSPKVNNLYIYRLK